MTPGQPPEGVRCQSLPGNRDDGGTWTVIARLRLAPEAFPFSGGVEGVRERLRKWLRRPGNAKRLLVESGALTDDLARFANWWRPEWDAGVDLERPHTWFDVDLEENVPLPVQVGWPEAPLAGKVVADAVLRLRWRRPAGTPSRWAEAMRRGGFAGTERVYVHVRPDLSRAENLLSTLRLLQGLGFRPWLVLTASALWPLRRPAFEGAGAFLYGVSLDQEEGASHVAAATD